MAGDTQPGQLTGAVMVVGGGIGGMQASLDLAESGFKVYLVETKSAIGGHMAQSLVGKVLSSWAMWPPMADLLSTR